MLILSRRKDEKILIGDDIEITVVAVKGNTVRLGIDAPKKLAVDREEVRSKIVASGGGQASSSSSGRRDSGEQADRKTG